MKSKKIIYLEKILRFMAKAVLDRHQPRIVGITGSVGKTSTKAAVFAVLSSKFNVRENKKNYNNEIGIPLTIIGAESGEKNVFKWVWVFLRWIFTLASSKYPEILVLELGVDRPDDMKYFMSFLKPEVSIVTNISFSHLEFFNTVDNIAKEKRVLVEALAEKGWAILNADDKRVLSMQDKTAGQVLTFGLDENATLNASNVTYNYQDGKPEGISFKLNYDGKNIPIRLSNLLPAHYVYVALAAAAAGIVFKVNLVDIASALEPLRAPAGRMNLLEGINGSYIIDDTYNASPISTLAAIDVLDSLESKRKIVVLGDMLELGNQTEIAHRELGKKIFSSGKIDQVFLVGKRMKFAVAELVSYGYPAGKVAHFESPYVAAQSVAELVQAGDFVLVKGSQGMRMEKIVEQLLVKPEQAETLLCRQSPQWKKKLFMAP